MPLHCGWSLPRASRISLPLRETVLVVFPLKSLIVSSGTATGFAYAMEARRTIVVMENCMVATSDVLLDRKNQFRCGKSQYLVIMSESMESRRPCIVIDNCTLLLLYLGERHTIVAG